MRDMPRSGRRTAGAATSSRCSRSATCAGSRRRTLSLFHIRSSISTFDTRKISCGRYRFCVRRCLRLLRCGMPVPYRSSGNPLSVHRLRNVRIRRRYLIDAVTHLRHFDAVVQFYCSHVLCFYLFDNTNITQPCSDGLLVDSSTRQSFARQVFGIRSKFHDTCQGFVAVGRGVSAEWDDGLAPEVITFSKRYK